MIESRSQQYVEERVRAGVLEQGTADLMVDTGVGERLRREGLVHYGLICGSAERRIASISRIDWWTGASWYIRRTRWSQISSTRGREAGGQVFYEWKT